MDQQDYSSFIKSVVTGTYSRHRFIQREVKTNIFVYKKTLFISVLEKYCCVMKRRSSFPWGVALIWCSRINVALWVKAVIVRSHSLTVNIVVTCQCYDHSHYYCLESATNSRWLKSHAGKCSKLPSEVKVVRSERVKVDMDGISLYSCCKCYW